MERHTTKTLCSALLLALTCHGNAAEAPAEERRQPDASSRISEVVVTTKRLETQRQIMTDFVVNVADTSNSSRGLARWRNRLCVGIHNLRNEVAAQFLADRISEVALELGLRPGEPGCYPDVSVIFTTDGRDMATRLVEATPSAFRPFGNTHGTTKSRQDLEKFQTSEDPVRWWQVTMIVDELGRPAVDVLAGLEALPQYRGSNSRVKEGTSDDIWANLIIVDTSKVQGKTWAQLADYIAMVSLAQVKPGSRPSNHDSILNLFSEANPPAISDMDMVYLKALYSMDTMIRPRTQRGMLASWMIRTQREMEEIK